MEIGLLATFQGEFAEQESAVKNRALGITLLGFKEDFQMDVFKVLAAILYLGNVQIAAVGNERLVISVRYVT